MPTSTLGFKSLIATLDSATAGMKDPRQKSNATAYSLRDAVLGGFSAFFMQSDSFLDYQRQLHSRHGRDNVQSLFGVEKIPSVEQIRNILDQQPAERLFAVFKSVYQALEQGGYLQRFEVLDKHLLIALDGTEYYSSQKVSCPCCLTRQSRNGQITYSHKAILPVIVSPEQTSVISLPPEFIEPQDGQTKQDCEQNAAKRWLQTHADLFQGRSVTLLGDDLYSRQPTCETALSEGFSFIFVCLPESHGVLYDWIDFQAGKGHLKTYVQSHRGGKTDEHWQYRYLTDVPLTGDPEHLSVNCW
jgi:hypothetical protein